MTFEQKLICAALEAGAPANGIAMALSLPDDFDAACVRESAAKAGALHAGALDPWRLAIGIRFRGERYTGPGAREVAALAAAQADTTAAARRVRALGALIEAA